MKNLLSYILSKLFITDIFFKLSLRFYGKNHIRVVNYHGTDSKTSEIFENQMKFLSKYYDNCSKVELDDFFKNKIWNKPKPGLILSFDDGIKSNYDIAAPILEKYNFTGWFCIPPQFVDTQIEKQSEYMSVHNIIPFDLNFKERSAMNWQEINDLFERKHVIIAHTFSHYRVKEADTNDILNKEIVESKQKLESQTGNLIDIFCWVGGEEQHYTNKASLKIIEAGYKYSFMTNNYPITKTTNSFKIQRTNIESTFPDHFVKLSLSGLYDIYYFLKRNRVEKKTFQN